jgi:hypothetical protein
MVNESEDAESDSDMSDEMDDDMDEGVQRKSPNIKLKEKREIQSVMRHASSELSSPVEPC